MNNHELNYSNNPTNDPTGWENMQDDHDLNRLEKVWNLYKQEIVKNTGPFITEVFDDQTCKDLMLEYHEDPGMGADEMVDLLSSAFEIEPPKMVKEYTEGFAGAFNRDQNIIRINQKAIPNYAKEYHISMPVAELGIIAHEMWHAYQHKEANDPSCESSKKYQGAFKNYIGCYEDSTDTEYLDYQLQYVELEAKFFQHHVSARLAKVEN